MTSRPTTGLSLWLLLSFCILRALTGGCWPPTLCVWCCDQQSPRGRQKRSERPQDTCLVALPDLGLSTGTKNAEHWGDRRTCSTYPSKHVEPAAFIFHLNKDFECAAPIALCKKTEERWERRKSLSMPNLVKKLNVAHRSRILFQFLRAPAPQRSSLLLITEASQSRACSSSCLLLPLPVEKLSAAVSSSPSRNAEMASFHTSVSWVLFTFWPIGTDTVAPAWPAYQCWSGRILPKF